MSCEKTLRPSNSGLLVVTARCPVEGPPAATVTCSRRVPLSITEAAQVQADTAEGDLTGDSLGLGGDVRQRRGSARAHAPGLIRTARDVRSAGRGRRRVGRLAVHAALRLDPGRVGRRRRDLPGLGLELGVAAGSRPHRPAGEAGRSQHGRRGAHSGGGGRPCSSRWASPSSRPARPPAA